MTIPRPLVGLVIVAIALAAGVGVAWGKHHHHAAEAGGESGLAGATLLVVRHAEKPTTAGDRGLSAVGDARARAYADYFRHLEIDGAPVHVGALLASADTDESARPRLTLEPLAKATELTVETPFANKQVKDFANWLQAGPPRGTVLIAWHHGKLAKLLAQLGADPTTLLPDGAWPEDVYDWLVVLRYDGAGRLVDSKRIIEPAGLARG